MAIAIWWARRDLRLADNQALHEAMLAAETVLPVFILDPALLSTFAASEKRLAFLFGGLRALDADLRERGSRLIVRRGDPATELVRLVNETGATAVFAEEDVSPYARRRDAAVAAAGAAPPHARSDCPPTRCGAQSRWGRLHRLHAVQPGLEGAAAATPVRSARAAAPSASASVPPSPDLAGLPIPDAPVLPASVPFPSGEAEAIRRLDAFVLGPSSFGPSLRR